jgi:ribulose-5-phosphate 4-epimerase/fuculose-1-phosphate aldolase
MAVCSTEAGLQPTNFYACAFAGQLAYHDFEGVTVRPEEGERLLANLGDKRVLMLRNHGPVVMGETIHEMFFTHWALQRACEIQVAAHALGKPVVVADEVIKIHQRDLHMATPPGGKGFADFEAWKRRVDRIDRSWRD